MSLNDNLREDFERQAEWRREKVKEYPDDKRNLEAIEILERLAGTADDCPHEVIAVSGEFFEEDGGSLQASEKWSEMMRQIGFDWEPKDAEAFCREFIANMLKASV